MCDQSCAVNEATDWIELYAVWSEFVFKTNSSNIQILESCKY